MLVIDSNNGVFSVNDSAVGHGLGKADPNYKYTQKFYFEDKNSVSPIKILNWQKGIIGTVVESYGGECPERRGQSVTAYIKSKELKIDVVPGGIFKRDEDGKIFYIIPSGSQSKTWIMTSPRDDKERLTHAANGKSNFKNVIRIAKRIKDQYNFLVSSFAIETTIIDYSNSASWYNDLYLDTRGVLKHISEVFKTGVITDPFDKKTNMIANAQSLEYYAKRIDDIITEITSCEFLDQKISDENIRLIFEN